MVSFKINLHAPVRLWRRFSRSPIQNVFCTIIIFFFLKIFSRSLKNIKIKYQSKVPSNFILIFLMSEIHFFKQNLLYLGKILSTTCKTTKHLKMHFRTKTLSFRPLGDTIPTWPPFWPAVNAGIPFIDVLAYHSPLTGGV